jgi:hypothetical protein
MRHSLYKSFLICSYILGAGVTGLAQSYDDQLLIFRNTGEVNLLYQSSIDSITLQNTDILGQWYDEPVMQVFYTPDTTLFVPISEIDSVCLGNRNEVEFKSDVHILDEDDLLWIASTIENTILYKLDTPDSYLPKKGEKLFYGCSDDLFPIGLCAKVESVTKESDGYHIIFSSIEIDDVFSKFFYAGDISDNQSVQRAQLRATPDDTVINAHNLNESFNRSLKLDANKYGSLKSGIGISISGPVVLQPLKHKYSAYLLLNCKCDYDIVLECKENGKINLNSADIHIPLGTIGGIFMPSIDLSLFFDLEAEMYFKYHQDVSAGIILDWKRENGENSFKTIPPKDNGSLKAEAKTELMLKGDIFFGLETDFNFAIVGDFLGARAKAKIGPHFKAEVGSALLSDLVQLRKTHDWNPTLYAKAKFSTDIQLTLDYFVTHRRYIVAGGVTEDRIDGSIFNFRERTLNLFPEFEKGKAIKQRKKNQTEISISTSTKTDIEYPVEVGFDVVDPKLDLIVDSLFVGEIPSDNQTDYGVAADIEINNDIITKDTLIVRPIFHYAGYTIPYIPINVSDNAPIQPIISYGNISSVYYVSGTPIVGTFKNDSTTFHVGPYIPVGRSSYYSIFNSFSTYIYGNSKTNTEAGHSHSNYNLTGTWKSNNENKMLILTFNEDNTGSLIESESPARPFTYEINKPTKQYVSLYTEDETIIFKVLSFENNTMVIYYKNHLESSKYFLTKQDD